MVTLTLARVSKAQPLRAAFCSPGAVRTVTSSTRRRTRQRSALRTSSASAPATAPRSLPTPTRAAWRQHQARAAPAALATPPGLGPRAQHSPLPRRRPARACSLLPSWLGSRLQLRLLGSCSDECIGRRPEAVPALVTGRVIQPCWQCLVSTGGSAPSANDSCSHSSSFLTTM